jgi:predicted O-linked N-acetylglucosamine transferase (SPINDLY family)
MLAEVYDAINRAEWDAARARCRALLASDPRLAEAHHAIGLTYCGEAAFGEAVAHFAAARRVDAASGRWSRDLGVVHAQVGDWGAAFAALDEVVDTLDAEALLVYLRAASVTCRLEPALARLDRRARPDDAAFLAAYGQALVDVGRYDDAVAALLRSLELEPSRTAALDTLGRAFERLNHGDRAFDCWAAYASRDASSAYAQLRLALASSDRGRCREGRQLREAAEALGLTRAAEHDAALYIRLSDPDEDAASILAASRAAFATAPAVLSAPPPGRRGGRLRIGYVSGEYRSTPAWYFFHPFLRTHDRSAVEVFLYNASPIADRFTARYEAIGEHWREAGGSNDAALAARMRADGLDVVVDLSGHFPYNRLPLLCDRIAPVQMTYPNYPATTGCPGVEWLFTDRWTSPPGTDGEYTERLYHLEPGYLVFELPDDCPPVAAPPASANGYPTFGVFQRLAKFNDRVWDAIAAVLRRVPDARLLLQNGEAELDRADSPTAGRLRAALAARGVDPARMTLRGPLSREEHLSLLPHVDVSLDTFPYSGQTTTCESLIMGVPVVTMRGRTHVGRVSGALLARTGHADWIADSTERYADIAASLVDDLGALTRTRATLRDDFVAAGLTDGRRLAEALERAYRVLVHGRAATAGGWA